MGVSAPAWRTSVGASPGGLDQVRSSHLLTEYSGAGAWSRTIGRSDVVRPILTEETGFGKVVSRLNNDKAPKHLSESYNMLYFDPCDGGFVE